MRPKKRRGKFNLNNEYDPVVYDNFNDYSSVNDDSGSPSSRGLPASMRIGHRAPLH